LRFGGFNGYCGEGRLRVDQVAFFVVTMFPLPKGEDLSGLHRITDTCCKCQGGGYAIFPSLLPLQGLLMPSGDFVVIAEVLIDEGAKVT
jgi:hypothetical protein